MANFTATKHVSLSVTAGEALVLVGALEVLTPDDVLTLAGPGVEASHALAVTRATKRISRIRTKGGRIKFTLVEAGALLITLEALPGGTAFASIKTRIGVELARQGGAKVGRR